MLASMQRCRRVEQIVNTGPQQLRVFLDLCVVKCKSFLFYFHFSKLKLMRVKLLYISLVLWLDSRVFPFQIDNSVPVSCDVAAGACFFCYGCIGRLRTDRENISDKTLPYLNVPSTPRLASPCEYFILYVYIYLQYHHYSLKINKLYAQLFVLSLV